MRKGQGGGIWGQNTDSARDRAREANALTHARTHARTHHTSVAAVAAGTDPSTLPAVAAASLLHNDIFAPSKIYPTYGDPQCPSAPEKLTCATAVSLCPTAPGDDSQTPWTRPTAGVLLLPDAMREAMGVAPGVDLKADKEYTTSYAKDSNCADQRAAWKGGGRV